MKKSKVYVGMDVHKDTVMIAVLPEGSAGADAGETAVARTAQA